MTAPPLHPVATTQIRAMAELAGDYVMREKVTLSDPLNLQPSTFNLQPSTFKLFKSEFPPHFLAITFRLAATFFTTRCSPSLPSRPLLHRIALMICAGLDARNPGCSTNVGTAAQFCSWSHFPSSCKSRFTFGCSLPRGHAEWQKGRTISINLLFSFLATLVLGRQQTDAAHVFPGLVSCALASPAPIYLVSICPAPVSLAPAFPVAAAPTAPLPHSLALYPHLLPLRSRYSSISDP